MKNSSSQIINSNTIGENEPLIIANDKQNYIALNGGQEPAVFSKKTFLACCPPAVIDSASLELIQVQRLHQAIDHTRSLTGSATLLRSLIQPSTDLEYIRSKQESVSEILSDDRLFKALRNFIQEFGKTESALYKFFNKDIVALSPYRDLKTARLAAANFVKMLPSIPAVESSYLNVLIANLNQYQQSPVDQMLSGSVYKTFSGLKSKQEVGFFSPKLKFVPHRFSKWLIVGPALFVAPHLQTYFGKVPSLSPVLSSFGLALTGVYAFYSLIIKPIKDTGNFIEPLRKRCLYDNAFSLAIDTLGMIDELLSFCEFTRHSAHATTIPKIIDKAHHSFEADGLTNPVLAADETDFVSNNFHINGPRLAFITGPNSGGKTTICKSIVHNQLLAQIGSPVLAEKATINIADTIRYQAPQFDGLQDEEGRFGTELIRTRDIFYSTSPKSLVILDELAEGTTHDERMDTAFGILSDFYAVGNNTILVTHNHPLVDKFVEGGKGKCLKVELRDGEPTYKLMPGISRVSHSDRIAERINFSKTDRLRHMKEKGYL